MMNSGKYYVGDLCYVFSDEEWEKVCALIIDGHTCKEGEFQLEDGRQFAIYNTAYGDGRYYDEQGRSYSVDSGSIGCILFDDVQCSVPFWSGGQIIDFDNLELILFVLIVLAKM